MTSMHPDFGKTAEDYVRHRRGFPPSLFYRLETFGIGMPGQRVVDLGTGTGTLARGFAQRGCIVVGIDPAESLLEQARLLDKAAGVTVDYRIATAEATGLANSSSDVVSAGQCWHWFDRDLAAHEVARILKPGGRLLIAHFDWLPYTDNVVYLTEKLIKAHNPNWHFDGGLGIYPQWLRGLGDAGYWKMETLSYDVDVPYTHEGWRGRIRASAGVAASLPAPHVEAFDIELQGILTERFPGEELTVPHRVFALIAEPPADS